MYICKSSRGAEESQWEGDTCSKETLIYIPKCWCQIRHRGKGALLLINEHAAERKDSLQICAVTWIFYANGISDEVQPIFRDLDCFLHSPRLKFMPPLIYNFINSSPRRRRGKPQWWNSFASSRLCLSSPRSLSPIAGPAGPSSPGWHSPPPSLPLSISLSLSPSLYPPRSSVAPRRDFIIGLRSLLFKTL